MKAFSSGPLTFEPVARGLKINSEACHCWTLRYGQRELAMHTLPDTLTQDGIREEFAVDIEAFRRKAEIKYRPDVLELIEEATGEALARIAVSTLPAGFSGCIPDDRHRYWLLTAAKPQRGMPVTLQGFAKLSVMLAAPERAWIASLLPDDVLSSDPDEWRAPSSWEIRHVVGEGSFTGISGARAAALVGVTPQNFRKYIATDGAKSRQTISFAMWHLLLHKLGVARI